MRLRTLMAASLALAGTAMTAGNASAAVVGIERATVASASSSQNKAVTVACPAGKKVLSAAADVTPGNGDVLIDDVRPSADLQSVTVNALEDETGTATAWTVSALAVCAFPPPGLERVSATTALNSASKSVTASCPAGKRVLGVGADLNTFVGQVLLDDIRPNGGLTSVTVNALEDETGNSTNWSVTAYAVCAQPVQGLIRVSSTSALDSTTSRVVSAPCPAGRQLTGAGGDINTFNGQVVLDASFPDPGATAAGFAAFEDDNGNASPWSLTAYGICADTAQRVVGQGNNNGNTFAAAEVTCPAGTRATGAGADLNRGFGYALLQHMVIEEDGSLSAYTRSGPVNEPLNGWFIRGYAICATPPVGLERVEAFSDSQTFSSLPVSCPAGKRLLGTAGGLVLGDGSLVFDGLVPRADLTGMTITSVRNPRFGDVLWATPLCANPPPGLQLVQATSPTVSDGLEFRTVTVSCAAGKHLFGTGARINGGDNQVVLDDVRPDAGLTKVTVTGYEDGDGYDGNWGVSAFGICVSY